MSGELRPPVALLNKAAAPSLRQLAEWAMTQSYSCLPRVPRPSKRSGHLVTVYESQVAQLQASKIERVRDASGSGGGGADIVDCGQFLVGKLGLGCEPFERRGRNSPRSFGTQDRLELLRGVPRLSIW